MTNERIIINGEIIKDNSGEKKINKNIYTIIVPYGKQSKVILPDKTVVWLNAGSRLFCPSRFDQEERLVYIDGEAFFEVSKNKRLPFVLKMHHSQIKVLGTSFNVKSYQRIMKMRQFSLEGSISLNPMNSIINQNIILKPEERIVVNSYKNYTISSVDIKKMITWRKGILRVKEESLLTVVNQISKFYGVDIKYPNKEVFFNKKISGKLDLTRGCIATLEHYA